MAVGFCLFCVKMANVFFMVDSWLQNSEERIVYIMASRVQCKAVESNWSEPGQVP